ncbi:MAG: ribosomal protein S18-alanine N-acetyltransferase [Candidatus Bathyarchaeia archaeon]
MSIHIGRATTDDLETLYSIERECFTLEAFTKEQLAYLLENPKGISLIARIDNEIAGFIMGLIYNHSTTKTGHVYTIDVAVKHRRKGVGLRLLRELEQRFVKNGVEICYLEARRGNVAALELYRKHGYTEVDILKNFYSEGVDGVRLMKKLSSPLQ